MNKWRLLEAIDRAGYSQRSLAKELGISKNTINNKVNGRVPFTTTDIATLCEKLKITEMNDRAEIFLS